MRNSWFSFLKKYPNVQSLCAAGAWPSPLRTPGLRAAGGGGRLPAPPPTSATVQRLGSQGYHQFSSSPAELVLPVAYKDISLMQGSRMMSTGILTPNSSDAEFPSDLLMPKRSMTDEERAQGLYQDLTMPVTNFHFEDKGLMVLAGDVFDIPIRKDIVHRVVRWQLAKRRQGTHSTKTISEVSGTGKKPYQQKGTGRARHGTLRGPQFRGGCVMHGPKPKSYEYKLNKKVRRMGLKVALSARAAEGKLVVLDDLEVMTHKTKNLVNWAQQMEGSKKILVVDGGPIKENLKLATQNLHYVNVLPSIGLNVYSILLHDTLVMSRDAVNRIVERMHTPINR